MNLTPQQQTFIREIQSSNRNLALNAVAGSGKTTTLVQGAHAEASRGPGERLAVAFNKKTAEELTKRFPSNYICKTMNALGHAAMMKMTSKRLAVSSDKPKIIIDKMWKYEERIKTPGLRRLVDLGRLNEAKPGQGFDWIGLADRMDLLEDDSNEDLLVERAEMVLRASIDQAWQGQIDFIDQLYMPVVFGGPFRKYPLVMVDEAQDLSPIQHKMIERSVGDRLVIVGDPAQAIYGFAGAHSHSMQAFMEKFDMQLLPLSFCFRCPQSVIREAREYNSMIEWPDGAPEGEVKSSENFDDIQPGDVVISYKNADLLLAFFALIRKGVSAKIVGSGDLASLLIKMSDKFPFESRADFLKRLMLWAEDQTKVLRERGKQDQASRLADHVTCLEIIVTSSDDVTSGPALRDRIANIFSLDGSIAPVTLMTIHKSKGLEFRRVHLFKFRSLFEHFSRRNEEDKQQRRNMAYVEITRAQQFLNFIAPKQEPKQEDDE